jgi:hypothetical protein
MEAVSAELIMTDEKNDHAGTDTQGEAQYVDEGIGLVAGDVPQGDLPMFLSHVSRFPVN